MAQLTSENPLSIEIPVTETVNRVTLYVIVVSIGEVSWRVQRRYNDFYELHRKLVLDHGIIKDILPAKKILGNKDCDFIKKRREALQQYLKTVINYLHKALPEDLAIFLEITHYEMSYIIQSLAKKLFYDGEALLEKEEPIQLSLLEIYAVANNLRNPLPQNFLVQCVADFTNVVDFISQVKFLLVEGSDDCYRCSSLVPNSILIDLSIFKRLVALHLVSCNIHNLQSFGLNNETIKTLIIKNCKVRRMSDFFKCDALCKVLQVSEAGIWPSLKEIDFSDNCIDQLDISIALAPNVTYLNLSNNRLSSLENITKLSSLEKLDLSNNRFMETGLLHTKLGNILELKLSQNNISSLLGFQKLYSLESLDLSCNNILDILEVFYLSKLPNLEFLILTGNPVSVVIDYRVKVLELMGQRACDMCLDNERPTREELDKVAVLQAIRAAREGRPPLMNVTAFISDTSVLLNAVPPDKASVAKE